jgi:hypothetical protein
MARRKGSEMQVEKTKPIYEWTKSRIVLYERSLWQYAALAGTKKQSQFCSS